MPIIICFVVGLVPKGLSLWSEEMNLEDPGLLEYWGPDKRKQNLSLEEATSILVLNIPKKNQTKQKAFSKSQQQNRDAASSYRKNTKTDKLRGALARSIIRENKIQLLYLRK